MNYEKDDYLIDNEDDEYVTRLVINPMERAFYLYSNEGDSKTVNCDNTDEFMNVLEMIRTVMPDNIIHYVDPLI